MMILTLLMFSVFDSIQENPGTTATVIFGVVGWFVQMAIFIWKMSQFVSESREGRASLSEKMDDLSKDFTSHETAFEVHKSNSDVHTTREQRESLGREIGQIRDAQTRGFAELGGKIDSLVMHFLDKAK